MSLRSKIFVNELRPKLDFLRMEIHSYLSPQDTEFEKRGHTAFLQTFGIDIGVYWHWEKGRPSESAPGCIPIYFENVLARRFGFGPEGGINDKNHWEKWFTEEFPSWRTGTLGDFKTAAVPVFKRNRLPF